MALLRSSRCIFALNFSRSIAFWVPIATVALLLASTGCGTALRVSHRNAGSTASPTSIPGVPFYAKKARCREEVVWLEPIYSLTLTAIIAGKDGALQNHPRGTLVLSRASFMSEDVKVLMKSVSNGGDESTILTNWRKVVPLIDPQILSRNFAFLKPDDRILVGSSSAPVVFVDYNDQYYVNAKLPFAGSANVDAKVAQDGSLSEASGQVQSQTLQTILSALPTSSLITGALGLGTKAIEPGKVEAFTLTVSISGYRHTLARFVDYPQGITNTANSNARSALPPCPGVKEISFADADEYKREDLSATPNGNKPKAPDDSQKPQAKTDKGKDGTGKASTGSDKNDNL
jgi:hypothetical protein